LRFFRLKRGQPSDMKSIDPLTWLRNELENEDNDLLRTMVAEFAEKLMSAEADALCGAAYGSRVPERTNHRNPGDIHDR